MPPLLEIRNLEIRFGAADAVSGISLHLDESEVLGLVGESGSGKSATALAMLGLLGPAAQVTGQILWRGSADSLPVSGHDFSRAANAAQPMPATTLKGHDFSRAANADETSGALAPEGSSPSGSFTNLIDQS